MPKKRSPGDGGLYWIESRGLWRGTVELGYDADGKRLQKMVYAKSQRRCRDKLDAVKAEIAEHGAPLDTTTRVAEWAERWLESDVIPHLKPNTVTSYKTMVRRWIVPAIGNRRVSALKPSDWQTIRKRILAAGRQSSTAVKAYRVLSLMLEAARKEGLCRRNIADDVKKPTVTKGRKRAALSTEDTTTILQKAAGHPDGSRWWLKLLGGPRQSEIIGATLDDLDLDGGTYTVNWSLEEVPFRHGCGDEADDSRPCGKKRAGSCPSREYRIPDEFDIVPLAGRLCLIRPKSRTGRVVPLIPQLVDALRIQLEVTAGQPNPYGLIWRHPDGSPILPDEDAQEWRDLLFEAGVIGRKQLAPRSGAPDGHAARHTTVTILASLGVDFQVIGEIVGHGSAEVTKIYRHAREEEKRAAVEKLGNVLVAPVERKALPEKRLTAGPEMPAIGS